MIGCVKKYLHIIALNSVTFDKTFTFLYFYFVPPAHEKEAFYPYSSAIGEMGSDAIIARETYHEGKYKRISPCN